MTRFTLAAAILLAIPAAASARDTGAYAMPHMRAASVVTERGLLPPNGSEGIEQSANSLPVGFADGTAPQVDAAIQQRYFAAQAARHGHMALALR